MPVSKVCRNCEKEFKVPLCRAKTAYTCSKACKYALHPKTNSLDVSCQHCGAAFSSPVSRVKRGNGKFCSRDCRLGYQRTVEGRQAQSVRSSGESNPMWRGGLVPHKDGYIYQREISHPTTSNGYVLQHRLVVEAGMREAVPDHSFLIDGYLSTKIHVHHRDLDKTNNQPDNLMAMTGESHLRWHKSGRLPEPWECWPNVHPGV